uniref:hypothetical protein n=1 Tax=Flavobacterium sp. TaxID=239 RepID=UPI0040487B1B
MIKKYLCFTILISNFIQAQESIQTDRPDQTETPAIVPKNMLQIETGFNYQKENNDVSSSNLPTILIKYGVNDILEIRLITGFDNQKNKNTIQSGFPNDVSELENKKKLLYHLQKNNDTLVEITEAFRDLVLITFLFLVAIISKIIKYFKLENSPK